MTEDRQFFDDDGRRAPAVGFDYDALDRDVGQQEQAEVDSVIEDKLNQLRRQAALSILEILTAGGAGRKVVGLRALALQYALNASPYRNQAELAERMGVTEARASQILTAVNRELGLF